MSWASSPWIKTFFSALRAPIVWSLVALSSNSGLLILFPYITQTYLPNIGTIHNDLSILTSSTNQENTSQTYLKANVMEAFPQLFFSPFSDDPNLYQLDQSSISHHVSLGSGFSCKGFRIQEYFVSWSRHYTCSLVLKIIYVIHVSPIHSFKFL